VEAEAAFQHCCSAKGICLPALLLPRRVRNERGLGCKVSIRQQLCERLLTNLPFLSTAVYTLTWTFPLSTPQVSPHCTTQRPMLPRLPQTGPNSGPGWALLAREAHRSLEANDYEDSGAGASHVTRTSSHATLDSVEPGNNTPDRVPRLPLEIIEIIVAFACGIQAGLTSAACTDARTTLRIALASKALHRLAQPLLYTCVTLTRPSQLMLYARTVVRRPKLAKLARTLWIGPDSETLLSPFWWPLNADRSAMRSSLTDPEKLPREVARGKWWPAVVSHEEGEPSNVESRAEAAVAVVIRGAWQRLDAAIEGPRSCETCSEMPDERHSSGVAPKQDCPHEEEWRLKAFEVQWLLDEYLQDWRKHQDTALRCRPESEHQELPGGAWPDPNHWLLSDRGKELKAGRGPCDLYDHPLLYERSGNGRFATEGEGEGFTFGSGNWGRPLGTHEIWTPLGTHDIYTLDVLDNLRSQSTPSGLSRLTTSDLLEAAAILLFRLTQLTGLALTAYTRAALASTLSVVPRSALRLLSLGPMPQPCSDYLRLWEEYFPSLETIHLQSESLLFKRRQVLQTIYRLSRSLHLVLRLLCILHGGPKSCQAAEQARCNQMERLDPSQLVLPQLLYSNFIAVSQNCRVLYVNG
jgi:hypothetical protein